MGAVIHEVHEQDMRKVGGLRKDLPIIFYCYTICAAAIAGLPFFSGFLSKDALLIASFDWATSFKQPLYLIVPCVILLSSGMTAFYMMRQLYMIFIGQEHLKPLQIARRQVVIFSKNIGKRLEAIIKVEDADPNEIQSINTLNFNNITNIDVVVMILAFSSIGFVFFRKSI